VALRERLNRGLEIVRPHLLHFYTDRSKGSQGHTVLAYETSGRVEVIDSAQADRSFSFPVALARDAMKLAQALLGHRVTQAILFPIQWPVSRPSYVSAEADTERSVASAS